MMHARKRMNCSMRGPPPPPPPPPPFHGRDGPPPMLRRWMRHWHHQGPPPPVHFKEEDESITIFVMAPGLKKESLDIKAKEHLIRISGKFQDEFIELGTEFSIQFEIPHDIDIHSGKAKYKDGIIILHFNRSQPLTKVELE